jgi:hypothetical protein
LCAGALGLATSRPAGAQEADALVESELEYRAARQSYQVALDYYQAEHNAYMRMIDQVRLARTSGDESALDQALGRSLSRSLEVQRLDVRVREQREALETARSGLLAALDAELARVQGQLEGNPPAAIARDLLATARGLRAQYYELEEEANDVLTPRNVVLPQLNYDPRDTPEELRNKVDFAQRRADQARSELLELDRQIERVERLLRVERSRGDFLGQLSRFGDDEVPVGQPGETRDRGAVADTAGLSLEHFPLDQQLVTLRTHREQMEVIVQILDEREQELRAHLPKTEAASGGPTPSLAEPRARSFA